MKTPLPSSVALAASLAAALCLPCACSPTAPSESKEAAPTRPDVQHGVEALGITPAAGTAMQPSTPAPAMAAADGMLRGRVLETMDTAGYTYVHVDVGGSQVWAACTEFEVAVGDEVAFPSAMAMRDYESSTLHRTFDVVYFADHVDVLGHGAAAAPSGAMAAGAQPGAAHTSAPAGAVEPVPPVEGGKTVAAVFAEKAALSGSEVTLRGRVVKFNAGILGRNWVHIKDGTGAAGTDDLTVTTDDSVAVGDVVLVKGTVALAKDFGAGYSYDVLVEKASVTKE
ncbi:MAG: nucleotide-binding protein [Planctomycetes bacterium]|nr:nucleotide-binding protein [Planctomycetota bacterium]